MASVNLTTPHCITTREAILYLERFGLGAISTVAGVHWVMSTAERDFRSSILLKTANIHAVGIGKIDDLFCGRGLSEAIHAHTNAEVIEAVIEVQRHRDGGFIFANRVEFDMFYGHRNDPRGFADALEYFDAQLPRITETLDDGDLLLLTQVICYGPSLEKGINIGTRSSFADVGMTIAEFLNVPGRETLDGKSFLGDIRNECDGRI
jgi:phosphopentomutase